MRVTIIKDSVIYKQRICKKGESIELDDKVAKSLLDRGYVSVEDGELIQAEEEETVAEAPVKAFEKPVLEEMDYKDIVQIAKDLNLNATGKKKEIISRILQSQEEEDIAEEDLPFTDVPNTDMPE